MSILCFLIAALTALFLGLGRWLSAGVYLNYPIPNNRLLKQAVWTGLAHAAGMLIDRALYFPACAGYKRCSATTSACHWKFSTLLSTVIAIRFRFCCHDRR